MGDAKSCVDVIDTSVAPSLAAVILGTHPGPVACIMSIVNTPSVSCILRLAFTELGFPPQGPYANIIF